MGMVATACLLACPEKSQVFQPRQAQSLLPGQVVLNKVVHPGVLQPHGVEHPSRGLRHPGRRVAGPLLDGDALAGDAPQSGQGVEFAILPAKAKGAGGGDQGVVKLHPSHRYAQISHRLPLLYHATR